MSEALPSAVPESVPFLDRTVDHAGLALRYRRWGDPSKPILILQHGGKDHARSWDFIVAELVADYCCVTPDLRGHGESGAPTGGGYDPGSLVTDFALVVEDLKTLGHAPTYFVIGHSLGGNIALRYSAAYPENVQRLVAIEGLGFSQKAYDEVMAKPYKERLRTYADRQAKSAQRGARIYPEKDEMIRRLAAVHPHLSTEFVDYLGQHGVRSVDAGYRWKHDPMLAFVSLRPEPPADYAALYKDIQCPVLLPYGSASWASVPGQGDDDRLSVFHDAELVVYDGAGHWLHHEQRERFIDDVRRFLASD